MDIHGEAVPGHLECIAPYYYSFHPIHLGGSCIEVPCKSNNRSLRSLTVPITPPALKTGTPPHLPERASRYSPILCFSLFRRELHTPSPQSYFSFMANCAKWKTGPDENPYFSTTPRQLSSDFRIGDGFWCDALSMAWNGVAMNVQFKDR
ncbi:hypothetical protein AVEN_206978-1 [Araneus ventricosus]|uniref:Uncharacterized protein n=1 Tax=Araneus ventricosus TaxID=182803 RepID=A0A4Y2LKX8_ARAVE|nr:hypothetical protein AVEN_206978-1 [Araneus ventricosus]